MDLALLDEALAGEPAFRARQVWSWAARGAAGYDEMTDVPAALRARLADDVPFSSLRAAAPAIAHPSKRHGVVDLDFEQFNYAFTNTWDPEEARAAFERYAVPETGRIFFQDGLANFTMHGPTEVDFDREDRGPLLITVGEHDHTVPPAVAQSNFKRYAHSAATTQFVEFPGRSHLLMAGPGWQEVAEYIAGWLDRVLRPAAVQEA